MAQNARERSRGIRGKPRGGEALGLAAHMAQTKKKRSTKHRGNAAGVVETRGRTGRKPTDAEKKPAATGGKRQDRFDRPPSWREAGSATRRSPRSYAAASKG